MGINPISYSTQKLFKNMGYIGTLSLPFSHQIVTNESLLNTDVYDSVLPSHIVTTSNKNPFSNPNQLLSVSPFFKGSVIEGNGNATSSSLSTFTQKKAIDIGLAIKADLPNICFKSADLSLTGVVFRCGFVNQNQANGEATFVGYELRRKADGKAYLTWVLKAKSLTGVESYVAQYSEITYLELVPNVPFSLQFDLNTKGISFNPANNIYNKTDGIACRLSANNCFIEQFSTVLSNPLFYLEYGVTSGSTNDKALFIGNPLIMRYRELPNSYYNSTGAIGTQFL
jgi:hypothetical protein